MPQYPVNARDKLRSDIMVVMLTRAEQTSCPFRLSHRHLHTRLINRARQLLILGGGYCSNTMYHEKLEEQTQQHQALVNMLMNYGYDVHLLSFPLGRHCIQIKSQDLGAEEATRLPHDASCTCMLSNAYTT